MLSEEELNKYRHSSFGFPDSILYQVNYAAPSDVPRNKLEHLDEVEMIAFDCSILAAQSSNKEYVIAIVNVSYVQRLGPHSFVVRGKLGKMNRTRQELLDMYDEEMKKKG